MSEELKACPFCGGEGELAHQDAQRGFGKAVFIWCPNCGSRTGLAWAGSAAAIAAWNHRAADATLTARIAAVEAERDAAVARAERSHETLIHADMKIRSLPHTDQSDVEFIRTAMTDGGGDLIGYASNLARSLVAKYYPDNTGWQPLPDLMGLLTQIDNATTGIAEFGERRAIAASQAQVADWRRREMQAIGAAISTRSWHELERAYNQLRDKMDAMPRSDAVHPSHPPSDLQHYDIGWDNGIAEGRRQATAAIVAWLKQGGATSWTTEAIERGDHLPSAGDAGEG